MTKPDTKKIYISLLGIMLATTLFFSQGFKLSGLDNKADDYFKDSITDAGLAYATCRLINAGVSIVQNSDLNGTPGGVGVSLAAGQILDPIDDMTERLSDVLVTAIVSLGIQKLIYEISLSYAPPILAILLFALSILIWFKNKKIQVFQKTILKITMIVLVLRFCLPISSIANNLLHENFFKGQIAETKGKLEIMTFDLDELSDFSLPQTDGLWEKITGSASLVMDKAALLKDGLMTMKDNMGDIISNLVRLTTLYVGVFVIQVIILPLAVFWLLIKMTNALFKKDLPVIIKHSRPRPDKVKKQAAIKAEGAA